MDTLEFIQLDFYTSEPIAFPAHVKHILAHSSAALTLADPYLNSLDLVLQRLREQVASGQVPISVEVRPALTSRCGGRSQANCSSSCSAFVACPFARSTSRAARRLMLVPSCPHTAVALEIASVRSVHRLNLNDTSLLSDDALAHLLGCVEGSAPVTLGIQDLELKNCHLITDAGVSAIMAPLVPSCSR